MGTISWMRGAGVGHFSRCRDAIRRKVAHLYPAHEVDSFSERFFALVQQGRQELGEAEA